LLSAAVVAASAAQGLLEEQERVVDTSVEDEEEDCVEPKASMWELVQEAGGQVASVQCRDQSVEDGRKSIFKQALDMIKRDAAAVDLEERRQVETTIKDHVKQEVETSGWLVGPPSVVCKMTCVTLQRERISLAQRH
jgi:hypothetical protein